MKILLVSSYLPYPLYSGGQVRLFNLIKELSEKHAITLICEKRPNQSEKDIEEVRKICKKVITVERRRQWGMGNILKTTASLHSFLVTGHTHQEMKQKIQEELSSGRYDLIHVETFYVMQNLPAHVIASKAKQYFSNEIAASPRLSGAPRNDEIPIVLAEHNIEYQVYKRFVDRAAFIVRPLLMLDIAKIKREEIGFWKRADKIVAVSEQDAGEIRRHSLSPEIVPNGVDTEKFSFLPRTKIQEPRTKKILFMGDFKWLQNRDAVKFIIEEVWPNIRSKIKDQRSKITLWIVGRKIPDSIKNLTNDSDIVFDEESSSRETEEIFQEADILLAPIRIGGGTSYKILESMSCGTPVVTMPMSAQAISARDSEELMIGENAEELAEKVAALFEDKKLYEKVAKNGRKLIEEKYTWKNISGELEKVYADVIASD